MKVGADLSFFFISKPQSQWIYSSFNQINSTFWYSKARWCQSAMQTFYFLMEGCLIRKPDCSYTLKQTPFDKHRVYSLMHPETRTPEAQHWLELVMGVAKHSKIQFSGFIKSRGLWRDFCPPCGRDDPQWYISRCPPEPVWSLSEWRGHILDFKRDKMSTQACLVIGSGGLCFNEGRGIDLTCFAPATPLRILLSHLSQKPLHEVAFFSPLCILSIASNVIFYPVKAKYNPNTYSKWPPLQTC